MLPPSSPKVAPCVVRCAVLCYRLSPFGCCCFVCKQFRSLQNFCAHDDCELTTALFNSSEHSPSRCLNLRARLQNTASLGLPAHFAVSLTHSLSHRLSGSLVLWFAGPATASLFHCSSLAPWLTVEFDAWLVLFHSLVRWLTFPVVDQEGLLVQYTYTNKRASPLAFP